MRAGLTAAVTIFAAACGGSSGSGGSTADKACTDLAQARCSKRASCSNGANITRVYGEMATCTEREKQSCMTGLAAPSTGNTPDLVEACVAAFSSYSCTDFLQNNPPSACKPTGPKADGSPCGFNAQCTSGFCANSKESQCGTCGSPPALGSPCLATFCGPNAECVASSLTCEAFGAVGTACDSAHPCGVDLACIGATMTQMGTCQNTMAMSGAACGNGKPFCDGTMGLYCGGTAPNRTCMIFEEVGNGMPCGTMSDGSFVACKAGACYSGNTIAGSGQSGTCKAFALEGAACDDRAGPTCLSPGRCIGGTCALPTGMCG